MRKKLSDKELILEAHRINYSLRSTFFYRRLNELGYFRIIKDIDNLVRHSSNYSWEDRKFWNITHNAWDFAQKKKINPIRIFTHPKILVEHPKLIAYYRNVAAIPLKGVHYLTFDISRYELEKKDKLDYSQAMMLCKLFNTHISAIVESTMTLKSEHVKSLMFTSAGATIDGSWRNKIGEEAENMVKSYILRCLIGQKLIESMIDKTNSPIDFDEKFDYIANICDFKGAKLKNKKSIIFSSEPDVSIIDKSGKPEAVIEVKGGTDPAGALERLGAIKKSFEDSRCEHSKVKTILVISCVTKEMEKRLKRDKSINYIFNLTAIINDMNYRDEFITRILGFVK